MPTIKELKEDLQFNTELVELLDVMKNTAVFQFRALQAKKERFENLFRAIRGFFRLIGDCGSVHPLIAPQAKREAIIMVTSDEGFMGNLNSQVINAAGLQEGFEEAELIIIGERGARLLREMDKDFVPFKAAVNDADRRTLAEALGDYIIKGARQERFGKVAVSYPKPISFMLQRVEIDLILPLAVEDEPVYPQTRSPVDRQTLIIESPPGEIIEYLAEEMVKQRLVGIFEDSKLSEFAARALHLENSSQQLTEKKKKLKLQYFKAYHEMIDKSTRELFSAQIIIHGGKE